MNKSLYCIRRAHVLNNKITNKGYDQIRNLRQNWSEKNKKEIELVISESNKPSYDTAKDIFHNLPIIKLGDNYFKNINTFYTFLRERDESVITFVGDQQNIRNIKCTDANSIQDTNIKHCYPYLIELSFKDICDN